MKIALSTQPEAFFPLLIRSLKLYRASFVHVFFLALLLSIIAFIPDFLLMINQNSQTFLLQFGLQRLWLIFINLGCLLIFSAILWQIRCTIMDIHEDLLDDAKIALKKIPYIFIANLLQAFLITGIIFLFIQSMLYIVVHTIYHSTIFNIREILLILLSIGQFIVAIYLFFAFYFYMPIILIENKSIISALAKSVVLVWKNWWRTLYIQITPWVIYILSLSILSNFLTINIHTYFIEQGLPETPFALGLHILIFALFIPWIASVLLIQLRDLELRKNIAHQKI